MDLKNISDERLEVQLSQLVLRERKILHAILVHIQEVERRKLYLKRAVASLFSYLVNVLGYSSSAAQRRIEAARLATEVPDLLTKIQEGSVNLTQLSILSQASKQTFVSTEVKQEIISLIARKSTAETQKLISRHLNLQLKPPESKFIQKDESVHLSLTLEKTQFANFQRCRELMAHKLMQENKVQNAANTIEGLTGFYLYKKDPEKVTAVAATGSVNNLNPARRFSILRKYPDCQFRDPDTGQKCTSRYQLEVEHLKPQWAGGGNEDENLTVLCSRHNKYKYLQQSGRL